jgi:hypothetical protein
MPPEERLTIKQDDLATRRSAASAGGPAVQWPYLLDGAETRARIGGDTQNSVAEWECAALLINTLVSGSSDYTVMDR